MRKLTNTELESLRETLKDMSVADALFEHIDALEHELEHKYDLVTLSDIARIDGVSRQNAYSMSLRPGFPEPITSVGRQRLWAKNEVERYLKERFA